ncbi:MAG TPA: UDP-N-acetylglucosamine 2-epimerase (non-hydrolyzing) [Allosphingosinicella sp.]
MGTRPEAIKMAPVVRAIADRPHLRQELLLTGQHAGLAPMFAGVGPIHVEELPFDGRSRSPARLREALHGAIWTHLKPDRPDLVLVHGDTASAIAGALAARDCAVPVGHVEAGLRSFDIRQPWPEEGNRIVIDTLSELLFAPTEEAVRNLRAEWRVKGHIHLTGNSGIDALLQARERIRRDAEISDGARRTVLVTCHRKENQGAPARNVCAALRRLPEELPIDIVVALHTNPQVRQAMEEPLRGAAHVRLLEPLDYPDMVALMERSWLILTDSGGLQEEGPALGKPVFVLRNTTERPEGLVSAAVELIGTEEERIVAGVRTLFHDADKYAVMSRPCLPFGDGRAAPRIAAAIDDWFDSRRLSR